MRTGFQYLLTVFYSALASIPPLNRQAASGRAASEGVRARRLYLSHGTDVGSELTAMTLKSADGQGSRPSVLILIPSVPLP